jgi:hypothetical protein
MEKLALSIAGEFLNDGGNNSTNFGIRFALSSSFSDGSPYIGATHTNIVDGGSDTNFVIGYGRANGVDLDYDIAIMEADGNSVNCRLYQNIHLMEIWASTLALLIMGI